MTESTKDKLKAMRADLIAKRDSGQWEGKGLEDMIAAVIASVDQQIIEEAAK